MSDLSQLISLMRFFSSVWRDSSLFFTSKKLFRLFFLKSFQNSSLIFLSSALLAAIALSIVASFVCLFSIIWMSGFFVVKIVPIMIHGVPLEVVISYSELYPLAV